MEQKSEAKIFLLNDLIKPVQVLNRYPLFFAELLKLCEKTSDTENKPFYEDCHRISKEICKNANDFMATGKIQNFPENQEIENFGYLIERGPVHRKIPKKKSLLQVFGKGEKTKTTNVSAHLFLFKKWIVLCNYKPDEQEFGIGDEYRYWTMLPLNKMKMEVGEANQFELFDVEKDQNIVNTVFACL